MEIWFRETKEITSVATSLVATVLVGLVALKIRSRRNKKTRGPKIVNARVAKMKRQKALKADKRRVAGASQGDIPPAEYLGYTPERDDGETPAANARITNQNSSVLRNLTSANSKK